MRIAIIEGDYKVVNLLKDELQRINNQEWYVLFFNDVYEFGKADVMMFNVVISACSLGPVDGKDLLHAIHKKTDADLYLMCDTMHCINDTDISKDYIKGVIKKTPEKIIGKLKYLETKYRLASMIEAESESMSEIVLKANGYSFKVNEDVAHIKIKRVLSEQSKSAIMAKIDESKVNKVIVSYPDRDQLETLHCGQIFDIYKKVYDHGGKIVFCNSDNQSVDVLQQCKIDHVMPVFEDEKKAVEFLHTQ